MRSMYRRTHAPWRDPTALQVLGGPVEVIDRQAPGGGASPARDGATAPPRPLAPAG